MCNRTETLICTHRNHSDKFGTLQSLFCMIIWNLLVLKVKISALLSSYRPTGNNRCCDMYFSLQLLRNLIQGDLYFAWKKKHTHTQTTRKPINSKTIQSSIGIRIWVERSSKLRRILRICWKSTKQIAGWPIRNSHTSDSENYNYCIIV